ncbi:MAG: alpha-L-arabinofuranosidase C-terminal domain-containing protein [Christiangramia sp.]|uniref:alpha-L-arabinofuranosidase C-terminal domain-containing protein n=1 Tax=Christiangramia sp. TaxID=1931228 RepID=UPI0032420182
MRKLYSILIVLIIVGSTKLKAQDHNLSVDASKSMAEIQPTMYGIFFEDINFAADGGLYPELVKNRSFEFELGLMGWEEPNSDRHSFNQNSGKAQLVKYSDSTNNHNYVLVTVNDPEGYELINQGYRGMGIKKGEQYRVSFDAANKGAISAVKFELLDEEDNLVSSTTVPVNSINWKSYETEITPSETVEKAKLRMTFEGTGDIWMDMISIFPKDTWKGRKNGLRKDLVQLLAAMNPGFLRFPGGCIVEGRTLAQRYQWKKTVGPVEERETLVNRWNEEFSHRLTPDYFQSFGLGFYEYFQLSEDLGSEPLPILSCGIACQFNTGELVPMQDLDPYIQDALDLIEFANGGPETNWGKVRAEMGHPEPFQMKYIGIGNEQWGPEYIKRYKEFEKAIQAKYPEIIIVSGSGPFPDGEYFEYGWEQLKEMGAAIVDEHYYRSPEWFRENANRYDHYDRSGPKVFAGEYAAQSVAIASPENKNNWETALSEAAFMTGLERNADVVTLTSYAPLMAHKEGWQWTPDMIWFDNLQSYGTPNYYVQKLFGTNSGTNLLKITEDGKELIGQEELYASAVTDTNSGELIIKLVNTSSEEKSVKLDVKGTRLGSSGKMMVLQKQDLSAENSFENPTNIQPVEKTIKTGSRQLEVSLKPYSLNVLKLKMS